MKRTKEMESKRPNPPIKGSTVVLTDIVKREVVSGDEDGASVTRTPPASPAKVKPAKDAKASTRAEPKPKDGKAVDVAVKATRSRTKMAAAPEAGGTPSRKAASPPVTPRVSVVAGGSSGRKAAGPPVASKASVVAGGSPGSKAASPPVAPRASVVAGGPPAGNAASPPVTPRATVAAGGSYAAKAASPPVAIRASVVAGGKKCVKPAPAAEAVSGLPHKKGKVPSPKGAAPEPKKRVVKAELPSPTPSNGKGKPADKAAQAEGQGDGWKTVSKKRKSTAEAPAKVDGRKGKAPSKTAPGPSKSSSVRPLGAIREEARSTLSGMRTFCLRPESKVSKESGLKILDQADTLYQLVEQLLLRNSYLEGQLASVRGDVKRSQAAVESVVRKTIKARPSSSQPVKRTMTYAEKVKVDASRVAPDAVRPPSNMVRIFPPKGKEQDSDATKRAVLSIVKPAQAQIRVKSVRRIHSGGIVVETERKEDLAAFTGSSKLKEAGLSVSFPAKRNPTLIVYDVPKRMKKEELESCIWKQNLPDLTQKEVSSALKVRFSTGAKSNKEAANWVIEVGPEVRSRLRAQGRVYVDWMSCRVQDFVSVVRCFRCQAYGHTSKRCKSSHEVCGHCSEKGHTFASCKSKAKSPVCANCKAGGKKHDHSARDTTCASYKAAWEQVISRTCYE